jgi:hypothetical protein
VNLNASLVWDTGDLKGTSQCFVMHLLRFGCESCDIRVKAGSKKHWQSHRVEPNNLKVNKIMAWAAKSGITTSSTKHEQAGRRVSDTGLQVAPYRIKVDMHSCATDSEQWCQTVTASQPSS